MKSATHAAQPARRASFPAQNPHAEANAGATRAPHRIGGKQFADPLCRKLGWANEEKPQRQSKTPKPNPAQSHARRIQRRATHALPRIGGKQFANPPCRKLRGQGE